jgi:hypothetical protein
MGATAQVGFVQTALDAVPAVNQFPFYDRIHSKSLRALGWWKTRILN